MSTNLSTKTANSTNLERPASPTIERPSAGDAAIAPSTQQPLEQPTAEQPIGAARGAGLAQAASMLAEIEGELALQAYQEAADRILERLTQAAERNNAEIFKRLHGSLTQHYSGNPAIAAILDRYQK